MGRKSVRDKYIIIKNDQLITYVLYRTRPCLWVGHIVSYESSNLYYIKYFMTCTVVDESAIFALYYEAHINSKLFF